MADDKNAKPAPAAADDGDEGEGKKSNLIMVIGIIVGIVLIQGVLAYLIVPKPGPSDEEIAAQRMEDSLRREEQRRTQMFMVTESQIQVTTNIAETDGERFVKAAIVLEFDDREFRRLGPELERRIPAQFNSMFLGYMSALTLAELTEPGVRERINNDMTRLINESLPLDLGQIRRIHFREFIIQ